MFKDSFFSHTVDLLHAYIYKPSICDYSVAFRQLLLSLMSTLIFKLIIITWFKRSLNMYTITIKYLHNQTQKIIKQF